MFKTGILLFEKAGKAELRIGKNWVENPEFCSLYSRHRGAAAAPRGPCAPMRRGACAGAAGPYARRRCGARPYGPAGLLPCFGILAQKCDLNPILSRFWLGLVLWHPGKHFKASGTCIWIKWLRIPFYLWSGDLVWSWTSLYSGFAFTHYICLDRGKKTFNMHASHIRICMSE